jgi:hypothetical protein
MKLSANNTLSNCTVAKEGTIRNRKRTPMSSFDKE